MHSEFSPAYSGDPMTRALLAKVHIAKKELALSDETYRDILARVTGCQSSRDCSERQLEQLLDEFRRLGWKPKAGKGGSGFDKPHIRLIYALWKEAGKIGIRGHRSVGGYRASMYNALPLESVKALTEVMEEFAKKNG